MKKSHILRAIFALVVIVLIIVGGIYLFSDKERSVPLQQIANASSTTAILTSIRSDVFAKKSGANADVLISASTTILGNDEIKTGSTGRALVQNDDFKAVIDHDSEVVLSNLLFKNVKLSLNSGSVWLRVEKVFGVGEGLEVETPNAVAVVRGTSFGVAYQNSITTLVVTEGTVGFRGSGSSSVEVLVHVGEKAVVGPDGKVKVSSLSAVDKNTEWYKYNNPTIAPANPKINPNIMPIRGTSSISSTVSTTTSTSSTSNNVGTIAPLPPPPPDIEITSVDPPRVLDNQSTLVTINGINLNAVTILYVGETNFFFTTVSNSKITFNLTNMSPGTYNILLSGHGTSTTLSNAITIYSNSQQ